MASFSTIYAFGDSLSDGGNDSFATSLTGTTPVSPPYYSETYGNGSGNVFSNGPTWVQDLSIVLGLGVLSPSLLDGNDFAFGGAETGPTPQNGGSLGLAAISLPSQLAQFQLGVSSAQASHALFTLSIGANDVLDILSQAGLSAAQQAADVTAAVANEVGFIRQLASDGAKTLLVLDVPDLGKTPTVLTGRASASGVASAAFDTLASTLSTLYNQDLGTALLGINGIGIKLLDAYGLIDGAVANPAASGLSSTSAPIWSGNYSDASSGKLSTSNPLTQDQSLFWDSLHPTEAGHQGIAALAEQALGQTPAAQVAQVYAQVLQRAPDAAGLAAWTSALSSGALQPTGFESVIAGSAEAQTDVAPIVDLYTILGRTPDPAGLQAWVQRFEGGLPLATIAGDFLTSAEGASVYGTAAGTSATADNAFVTKAYQEVLGRAADAVGFAAWTGRLESGAYTPGAVLAAFVMSAEGQARDGAAATDFLFRAAGGSAAYAAVFPNLT